MGFVKWLKYIFVGFFNDNINKEGAKRSPLNIITQLLLVLILTTLPLFVGVISCFDAHYKDLSDLKTYTLETFTNTDLSLQIEFVDDEPVAKVLRNGKEEIIDSFKNTTDSKYSKNGYNIVIDTRDPEGLYAEFEIIYSKDGAEDLTYEQYNEGSYSGYTGNYKFHYDENGYVKEVDTLAKKDEYYTYLQLNADKLSTTNKTIYESLSTITDKKEFADTVYELYISQYYSISSVPTISYYYEKEYASTNGYGIIVKEDFVYIGHNYIIVSTHKDNGQVYNFYGYYDKFAEATIINSNESIDLFYKTCYDSLVSYQLLLSGYNVFNFLIYFIVSAIFLSLMLFLLFKIGKLNIGKGFFPCINYVNNYLPISGLIGGLGGFIAAFCVSTNLATIFACYFSIFVLFARTFTFAIVQYVKFKKQEKYSQDDNNINKEQSIDV